MLHDIKGKNSYCGPAAISAITGCTTDEAARIARHYNGARSIKGMYRSDVRRVLDHLGYSLNAVGYARKQDCPTLASWLKHENSKSVILIEVTGHFMVRKGDILADSKHRKGVLVDDYKHRRRRVRKYWYVKKTHDAKPIPEPKRSRKVVISVCYIDQYGDVLERDWADDLQHARRWAKHIEPGNALLIERWDDEEEGFIEIAECWGSESAVRATGHDGPVHQYRQWVSSGNVTVTKVDGDTFDVNGESLDAATALKQIAELNKPE